MTAGQRFLDQVHEQGIQQGVRQERSAVLLRLLRQRFAAQVDAHIERRLAAAPADQLEIWISRLLTAATLCEVFADEGCSPTPDEQMNEQ
jgi:hypothetical protein